MIELQLTDAVAIRFKDVGDNTILTLNIKGFWEFPLYKGQTLNDVFVETGIHPKEYDFFNVDDILEELEIEWPYDTFINHDVSLHAKIFLEYCIDKWNNEVLGTYPDKIVFGDNIFYGFLYFDQDDEESDEEELSRAKHLQLNTRDKHNNLKDIIKSRPWERGPIIYIFVIETKIEDNMIPIQTEIKYQTKKAGKKNKVVSRVQSETVNLCNTSYHYWRNWVKEILKNGGVYSSRFVKDDTGSKGFISVSKLETDKAKNVLLNYQTNNRDTKEMWW